MNWRSDGEGLSLSPRDLRVMAQCRMPAAEPFRREHPHPALPPLWSVLSYVMLRCPSEHENIWKNYRILREMAADTGKWYDSIYIPKAGGGARKISVPSWPLVRQQMFMGENILNTLPVSDHAFAYRKGRSIADCARPHLNRDVLIHLDIRNFFGSVTEDMVYEALWEQTGYAGSLCRFLARMCCLEGSLPQGAASSPALSNIVFRHCDEALAAVAQNYAMVYTRYSDDLFFSGSAAVPVGEVLGKITETLRAWGFRVNGEKTKVLRRQHRQQVLGLTVNARLQVTREYRRKLIQELYYLEKFGENCEGAIELGDYGKYLQQLQGKLAYVLHMDPDNRKLREAQGKLHLRIRQYAARQEPGPFYTGF